MNTFTRRGALRAIGAGAASLALPAFAAWPERPIKIVVSFPAGGASDIVARVLGEQLARKLGQPVVIDNRPGAGGSVGGLAVAQAAPDGYTLLLSNSTPISIGPFALEKQPYDPVDGFTHIALIGTAPCVVSPSVSRASQAASIVACRSVLMKFPKVAADCRASRRCR